MLLNVLRNRFSIGRTVPEVEPLQPDSSDSSSFSHLLNNTRLGTLFSAIPTVDGTAQASAALSHWFSQLESRCRQSAGFDDAVATALRFTPEKGTPVFQQRIAETPDWAVSLMGINRLMPIPLHDHPEIYSAQLVLHGKLHVRHFDPAATQPVNPSTAYLTPKADRILRRGEISSVTPGERNIHEMAAMSTNAVFLSIQSRRSDGPRQSWYFPVDPLRQNPECIYYKVVKSMKKTAGQGHRESDGAG